jgi:uncharacterized membrane-anchored protein
MHDAKKGGSTGQEEIVGNGMHPRKRGRLLWILILAQALVLVGLVFSYYSVDWFGKELRLKTAPIDPRDLFYGDYVILNYEISRLSAEKWKDGPPPQRDDTVYVLMRMNESALGAADAVGVFADRPEAGADEAVLKARVRMVWDEVIQLQYGLERYYVPEGTGKELERLQLQEVTVRVAPWGQAKVIGF